MIADVWTRYVHYTDLIPRRYTVRTLRCRLIYGYYSTVGPTFTVTLNVAFPPVEFVDS